jgi:hypothetical protein
MKDAKYFVPNENDYEDNYVGKKAEQNVTIRVASQHCFFCSHPVPSKHPNLDRVEIVRKDAKTGLVKKVGYAIIGNNDEVVKLTGKFRFAFVSNGGWYYEELDGTFKF